MPGDRAGGTAPGAPPVYPEREDTALLLPFARSGVAGTRLLDIGTGNGRLALEAAAAGAEVVATDVNPHAVRQLRERARAEGRALEVVRADLAAGLGRFDRVLANPPYLPTAPAQRDPDPWQNRALDGGRDGCRVMARIVGMLPEHLTSDGGAYLIVSSLQEPSRVEEIASAWRQGGGVVRRVADRRLPGERLEVWEWRRATRGG